MLRELGKGGMGVVYEARHTGTGRQVAVKVIVAEAAQRRRRSSRRRFQREARAAGAIETQHIAQVLDIGTDPATGHPYLVMELLHGEDLQERIVRFGPLSEDAALRDRRAGVRRPLDARTRPASSTATSSRRTSSSSRRDDEVVVKILDFGVAR